MKKSIVVSTPFSMGIVVFLLLVLLPTARFYTLVKQPFEEITRKLPEIYREQGIPPIHYRDHELHCDQERPFHKRIRGQGDGESFDIYIDTRTNPEPGLDEKIRDGAGGMVVYRDRLVFYNVRKRQETVLPLDQVKLNRDFTIDEALVKNMAGALGKTVFWVLISGVFLVYLAGKTLFWLLIALIYSGKARLAGGGNYSLALWCLVPPTLFQVFFPAFGGGGCCSCGVYYIILLVTTLILEKKLVPARMQDE
jgi:hypothetical protein